MAIRHNADRVAATLKLLASVDAFSHSQLIRFTDVVQIVTIAVGIALVDWYRGATFSTLRVTGVPRFAAALAAVLHRDAVRVRCAREIETNFSAFIDSDVIRFACLECGTLDVVVTFIFAQKARRILVTNIAIFAIAICGMVNSEAFRVGAAIDELAGSEAFLHTIIHWLAHVGILWAVIIKFTLISFLLAATIKRIVGVTDMSGEAVAVGLVVGGLAGCIRSTNA